MEYIKAEFLEKIKRSEDIMTFRFSSQERIDTSTASKTPLSINPEQTPDFKPGYVERVDFLPGQFLRLIFDRENKSNFSLNKYLSFSCSPGRDYIEVTKKISLSLFSQSLINLKKGDDVLINGPFGNCVFKPEYKKIAFLVGGVGITPVISILEYIYENRFPTDAVLIYSNKTEDIAFKKELDSFAENRENIRVFYTVSDYEPKNKNHIFGIINKNLILRKVEDFANRVFFIFGPPAMVKAMGDICFNSGCTKERLRIENFIGY